MSESVRLEDLRDPWLEEELRGLVRYLGGGTRARQALAVCGSERMREILAGELLENTALALATVDLRAKGGGLLALTGEPRGWLVLGLGHDSESRQRWAGWLNLKRDALARPGFRAVFLLSEGEAALIGSDAPDFQRFCQEFRFVDWEVVALPELPAEEKVRARERHFRRTRDRLLAQEQRLRASGATEGDLVGLWTLLAGLYQELARPLVAERFAQQALLALGGPEGVTDTAADARYHLVFALIDQGRAAEARRVAFGDWGTSPRALLREAAARAAAAQMGGDPRGALEWGARAERLGHEVSGRASQVVELTNHVGQLLDMGRVRAAAAALAAGPEPDPADIRSAAVFGEKQAVVLIHAGELRAGLTQSGRAAARARRLGNVRLAANVLHQQLFDLVQAGQFAVAELVVQTCSGRMGEGDSGSVFSLEAARVEHFVAGWRSPFVTPRPLNAVHEIDVVLVGVERALIQGGEPDRSGLRTITHQLNTAGAVWSTWSGNLMLATLARLEGELDEASRRIERVAQGASEGGFRIVHLRVLLEQALIALDRSDPSTASTTLDEASTLISETEARLYDPYAEAIRERLATLTGDGREEARAGARWRWLCDRMHAEGWARYIQRAVFGTLPG